VAKIRKGDRVIVLSGKDKGKEGNIIDVNMPIRLSKLAVISPKDGKATRVGFKLEADGTKIRVCKRTGAEIK
jgi:large subunit ribosomal protein L24